MESYDYKSFFHLFNPINWRRINIIAASLTTSNTLKIVPPMSDENRTDTPYQPPAPSDVPLAKKDADGPQAKPDPIHRQVQWLGMGMSHL